MTGSPCEEALAELFRYLDGELDEPTHVGIEAHLRSCAPCLEAFDFEVELHKVIASRCRDSVPAELKARILEALSRVQESSAGS